MAANEKKGNSAVEDRWAQVANKNMTAGAEVRNGTSPKEGDLRFYLETRGE